MTTFQTLPTQPPLLILYPNKYLRETKDSWSEGHQRLEVLTFVDPKKIGRTLEDGVVKFTSKLRVLVRVEFFDNLPAFQVFEWEFLEDDVYNGLLLESQNDLDHKRAAERYWEYRKRIDETIGQNDEVEKKPKVIPFFKKGDD